MSAISVVSSVFSVCVSGCVFHGYLLNFIVSIALLVLCFIGLLIVCGEFVFCCYIGGFF